MLGFVLFGLAGLVFGYAAPRLWAFTPVLIPIAIGVYTGMRDGFDGELVGLVALAVGITVAGVIVGRVLLQRLDRGGATA